MAAASVSLASSIADLAYTGGECVRVSFRLGVYVDNLSRSVEPRDADGTLESWAYVVTGLDLETVKREVIKYNEETVNASGLCLWRLVADSTAGQPKLDSGLHQRSRQELNKRHWSANSLEERFPAFRGLAIFEVRAHFPDQCLSRSVSLY